MIYGSNALQGIGATGGVVNQVTATAPGQDGWSGRTLPIVGEGSEAASDARR